MSKPKPQTRPTIIATQGKKTTVWIPLDKSGGKSKNR